MSASISYLVLLLDSLTKLDSAQKHHSANYSGGEKAGQSWTDKVFSVKQDAPDSQQGGGGGGGEVDDDEWVSMDELL